MTQDTKVQDQGNTPQQAGLEDRLTALEKRVAALEATTVRDARKMTEHEEAVQKLRESTTQADKLAPLDPRD